MIILLSMFLAAPDVSQETLLRLLNQQQAKIIDLERAGAAVQTELRNLRERLDAITGAPVGTTPPPAAAAPPMSFEDLIPAIVALLPLSGSVRRKRRARPRAT